MTTMNATTSIDLETLEEMIQKVLIFIKKEKDPARLGTLYSVRDNLVWASDSVEFAGECDPFACTLYDKAVSLLESLGIKEVA